MKSTLSLPSAVIALLLAGETSAYHLGGSSPRAMRNGRRQIDDEESVSPDLSTLPDSSVSFPTDFPTDIPSSIPTSVPTTPPDISFPTATTPQISLTFVPSTGIPSGAPPFPTGIFNSTSIPGPFPTASGSPVFPGNPGNGPEPNQSGIVDGPTPSVDCYALASSIFGSIFPYPTGGAGGGWPGPFPSGGVPPPPPSVIFGPPSVSSTSRPGTVPTPSTSPESDIPPIIGTPSTGPLIPDTGNPDISATLSVIQPDETPIIPATRTVINRRHRGGRPGPHGGPIGPIPSGVFPPGYNPFPTGVLPTPTEEQLAQISHFFEVCGWGKGKGKGKGKNHWWFPGKGGSSDGSESGSGSGKPGCNKDGDEE